MSRDNRPLSLAELRQQRQAFLDTEEAARRKRLRVEKAIAALESYLDDIGESPLPAAAAASPPVRPLAGTEEASLSEVIHRIVTERGAGMTYDEIKEAARQTRLGDKVADRRAFYGATTILTRGKRLVKHKGRFYSAAAFERFKADVAAGLVADAFAPPAAGRNLSPARDAILAFFREIGPGGSESRPLVDALEANPDLVSALPEDKKSRRTVIYNLVKRMVKRGELEKEDKEGGIIRLPFKSNGPSSPAREDGPEADGGDAPSVESPPALRLVS